MAYFEFGYVNTGYDENSATDTPPPSGEIEVILNMVYDTKDVVSETLVDLNYSVVLGTLEAICNFNYNVYSDFFVKGVNINSSVNAEFTNAISNLLYTIEVPIFLYAGLDWNYTITNNGSSILFISRLNQND